jgi:hypothetical protein
MKETFFFAVQDRSMIDRIPRFLLLLLVSWVVMTTMHEGGHWIGRILCGGVLQSADLSPWRLPFSFFDPDPFPLVTFWSGPIPGVLIPWFTAPIVRKEWMWLIAHFCLLANGLYLATGWYSGDPQLDTTRLLRAGTDPITLFVYCLLTIGMGYRGFRRECIRWFGDTCL